LSCHNRDLALPQRTSCRATTGNLSCYDTRPFLPKQSHRQNVVFNILVFRDREFSKPGLVGTGFKGFASGGKFGSKKKSALDSRALLPSLSSPACLTVGCICCIKTSRNRVSNRWCAASATSRHHPESELLGLRRLSATFGDFRRLSESRLTGNRDAGILSATFGDFRRLIIHNSFLR